MQSLIVAALVLVTSSPAFQSTFQADVATRFTRAIAAGTLAWQLSEPAEVQAVLGSPRSDRTERDGGMDVRFWTYSDTFGVMFGRQNGTATPFVLLRAQDGNRGLGAGPGDRLVLRTPADLSKLRPFTGLQNVDVSRLDLRGEEARLATLSFDGRTVWPPAERMPRGFYPARLLEAGKDPGLGVRALQAQGIDGRGVTIGIIDQPLLRDHVEIGGRLELVAELDVEGVGPQMHGPAVSSLAAGRTCGVAPAANVCYVAMPMWKATTSNARYIAALERLLEHNRHAANRIRVVSISYGGFERAEKADEWRAVLARAEEEGVLVITCDAWSSRLQYGLLKPLESGDRQRPAGYTKGRFGEGLLVPGHDRSYAQHEDRGNYAYAPEGGMSWGAPYLAGLAALGFQVNPGLTPARVRAYLVRSATKMPYGDVVNPGAFVQLCRDDPDRAGR